MIKVTKESIELLDNCFLSCSNDKLNIKVNDNDKKTLYLLINNSIDINITIGENANLKLVYIAKGNIDKFNLIIDMNNYAYLNLYESVISNINSENNITINLNGNNSSYDIYEFLKATSIEVSGRFRVNHFNKETTSNGLFHYIASGSGYINRNVESNIVKDMVNSKSSENIKGMILSSEAKILAKPILMVSNDDVSASHGCAIGTIDDNEIYYLMSRGLTKEEAKKIIAMSLVNPILREIDDKEFKEIATNILEDAIGE